MPERIVLDTNVFISAVLKPSGVSRTALDLARQKFRLVFTEATFAELRRTLESAKFRTAISPETRSLLLESLADEAEFVSSPPRRARLRDADDDKFADLALASAAHYLITGDKDILAMRSGPERFGFAILTPAEFLAAMR